MKPPCTKLNKKNAVGMAEGSGQIRFMEPVKQAMTQNADVIAKRSQITEIE